MKSFKIVGFAIIIILIISVQSFAYSNSPVFPEPGWSSDYYLESDNLMLGQIFKLREGLSVDLNDREANFYFFNQSYYDINIIENIKLGYFDFQEYYFSAEQGLVDFLSAVRDEDFSEGNYKLKGEIGSINLQGYYLWNRFNIFEDILISLRLKYINSGHLEKSKYDGRARMSDQFVYQSGYRQVIISRDKNYQPKGVSLDIGGEVTLRDDLSISFSAESLYSYIIFKDLYFREMQDRTGNFYYDDTAVRIKPVYKIDFDYNNILFGVSYINSYEPYIGYKFKLDKKISLPFDVELSLHRSKYGLKISPDWNRGDAGLEFQVNNFNLRKVKNLTLSFNISF